MVFRKMYEADKSAFPLIAEVSYSFNSNKNPFRDLATLVGEETGLKKGEKNMGRAYDAIWHVH